MTNKTAKLIRLTYGFILSAALVISGICLMAVCIEIYRSGEQPFTPASVSLGFSQIAIPIYVTLALVVGSFPLHLFLPASNDKKAIVKQYPMILKQLKSKYDLTAAEPELQALINAQQKYRKTIWLIFALIFTVCSIVFLAYGTNPANFHQTEINASMIQAMLVLLPCLAISFVCAIICTVLCKKSMIAEIDLIKSAIPVCPKKEPSANTGDHLLIPRLTLLGIGLASLIYGFIAGGTLDVLTKAVNICTECVGLG